MDHPDVALFVSTSLSDRWSRNSGSTENGTQELGWGFNHQRLVGTAVSKQITKMWKCSFSFSFCGKRFPDWTVLLLIWNVLLEHWLSLCGIKLSFVSRIGSGDQTFPADRGWTVLYSMNLFETCPSRKQLDLIQLWVTQSTLNMLTFLWLDVSATQGPTTRDGSRPGFLEQPISRRFLFLFLFPAQQNTFDPVRKTSSEAAN